MAVKKKEAKKKLTKEIVDQIRSMLDRGKSMQYVANKFNIHLTTVFQIKSGNTWNENKLKHNYIKACMAYVKKFSDKQKIEFDNFLGLEEYDCSVAQFGDYYFNLSDIIFDIETNQPAGLIMQWQDDSVDYHINNIDSNNINYKSYTKGLRYTDLKKQ
jgi:hypothetical protein